MDKRTVLAIALSLLVLMAWSAMMPKPQPVANKEVVAKISPVIPAKLEKVDVAPLPSFNFVTQKLEISFIEPLAAIKEIKFKDFKSAGLKLKEGFLLDYPGLNFIQQPRTSPDIIIFVHSDKDKKIIKKFIFSKSNYDIGLDIEVQNLSSSNLSIVLPVVLGVLDFSGNQTEANFQDITSLGMERISHPNPRKDKILDGVRVLGIRNKYFCAIIEPKNKDIYSTVVKKLNNQESEVSLASAEIMLTPGAKIEKKFRIYLGPQDLKIMNALNPDWSAVAHFGTFTFIAQILLNILNFLYSFLHNWGWAIIILSVLVYFILYPLTLKQMRSMKEMQVLQPRIDALRKLYKDNPQRLNKEVMQLYKEHKVNPFGGCLPLILQIPIFFALYQALIRFVAFKGAHFLWIKDLSEPDRLFTFPASLPIVGNEFNILPIVMAIEMFVQQKVSMAAATGEAAQQQKMMMIFMPIIFGLIFYKMPSGLVLYWFVNSTLMLIYQLKVAKK